jgi:hypothetical protein
VREALMPDPLTSRGALLFSCACERRSGPLHCGALTVDELRAAFAAPAVLPSIRPLAVRHVQRGREAAMPLASIPVPAPSAQPLRIAG